MGKSLPQMPENFMNWNAASIRRAQRLQELAQVLNRNDSQTLDDAIDRLLILAQLLLGEQLAEVRRRAEAERQWIIESNRRMHVLSSHMQDMVNQQLQALQLQVGRMPPENVERLNPSVITPTEGVNNGQVIGPTTANSSSDPAATGVG